MAHQGDKKYEFGKLEKTGHFRIDVKVLGQLFKRFLNPNRPDKSQNPEHFCKFEVVNFTRLHIRCIYMWQNHRFKREIRQQI